MYPTTFGGKRGKMCNKVVSQVISLHLFYTYLKRKHGLDRPILGSPATGFDARTFKTKLRQSNSGRQKSTSQLSVSHQSSRQVGLIDIRPSRQPTITLHFRCFRLNMQIKRYVTVPPADVCA